MYQTWVCLESLNLPPLLIHHKLVSWLLVVSKLLSLLMVHCKCSKLLTKTFLLMSVSLFSLHNFRNEMTVTLSADGRSVDLDAAFRFVEEIKAILESPQTMMLQ